MTNSLERLFDGLIDVLHTRVIPRIQDEFARGQAYGAIDMLRNLKPRVEWASGPLREDVEAELALADRIEKMLAGEEPRPPTLPRDCRERPGDTATALDKTRDAIDAHLCAILRWISDHRHTLAPERADEVERAIRDQQRPRLKREVKLTAPPLFGEISRGQ
jgi:hypothetical protein